HQLGAVMHTATIPDDGQRSMKMCLQVTQIAYDILAVNIRVVRQQIEVQGQPLTLGANADAADGRDAVAAIPSIQDRRLASRSPGTAHGRSQEEAGFIKENDMGVASLGFPDDARKLLGLP